MFEKILQLQEQGRSGEGDAVDLLPVRVRSSLRLPQATAQLELAYIANL